jgi:hypothetical protein
LQQTDHGRHVRFSRPALARAEHAQHDHESLHAGGLFDFTSDPAIEALKLMKQIMAYSNPDILLEGSSAAGVNSTPDEVAWAALRVGLYFKLPQLPVATGRLA